VEGTPQAPAGLIKDDKFIIWPHGPGKLTDFPDHLNSVHENIQFTTETERDRHLPFLDIEVSWKPDGSLGHRVYYKSTQTNLYLNGNSYHQTSKTCTFDTGAQGQNSLWL
jgi:hypothetical protein